MPLNIQLPLKSYCSHTYTTIIDASFQIIAQKVNKPTIHDSFCFANSLLKTFMTSPCFIAVSRLLTIL